VKNTLQKEVLMQLLSGKGQESQHFLIFLLATYGKAEDSHKTPAMSNSRLKKLQ
jgi:hypothetical protein